MTTSSEEFSAIVSAARAEWGGAERSELMHGKGGSAPRFEIYHAGLSVCSQKVRTVLAELDTAYLSNEMAILSGKGIFSEEFSIAENYRPNYVRLRMYGAGPALMANLMQHHTLGSSVESEGFDACVVPTAIDHQTESVIVDSSRIVEFIDAQVSGGPGLMQKGAELETEVKRQIKIVDNLPMGAILYGFLENDPRPDFLKAQMDGVYDVKRQALEILLSKNEDDAELVRAYKAKISKEMAGKGLYKNIDFLGEKMADFENAIANLNSDLQRSQGPWLHGGIFTMSDAFWGVSLYRIHWVGHAWLWQDYPLVKEYVKRLYAHPSIRDSVIDWPSPMPPSPHAADI